MRRSGRLRVMVRIRTAVGNDDSCVALTCPPTLHVAFRVAAHRDEPAPDAISALARIKSSSSCKNFGSSGAALSQRLRPEFRWGCFRPARPARTGIRRVRRLPHRSAGNPLERGANSRWGLVAPRMEMHADSISGCAASAHATVSAICSVWPGPLYRRGKSGARRSGKLFAALDDRARCSMVRRRDFRRPWKYRPRRPFLRHTPCPYRLRSPRATPAVSDADCGEGTPARWNRESPVSALRRWRWLVPRLCVHDDADDFDVVGRLENSRTRSESAICGTAAGETKLTASMCVKPASIRPSQIAGLRLGGICAGSPCQASRGHSMILTAFFISRSPLRVACQPLTVAAYPRDG